MRLGLWGARADNSGLGMQTWEFYNHMKPDKTLVVDISALERLPERVMKQYPERYPENATFVYGFPTDGDIREFLRDLDVVFIAESAYNNDFYRIARDMKVKVANQYNFEFFDWFVHTQFVKPDLFIAPSTWHYPDVNAWINQNNQNDSHKMHHVHLPVPVNRVKIPFKHRGSATTFVHIAGRPADHDRNGTFTFLEAISLSEGQLSGVVYTQDVKLAELITKEHPKVRVKLNVQNYAEIYTKGSVLVLPRKYGGNCLPMHEALSAGMPVIMSKLSPQVDFLPSHWLVNADLTDTEFVPRVKIDVYNVKPFELMLKMRWFKSLSSKDMYRENWRANELAEKVSWDVMEPKYREVFEAICQV